MKYVILTICLSFGLGASSQSLPQYKSLLVYKISEYVMWPDNPRIINVMTFGQSDVNRFLAKMADKKEHLNVSRLVDQSDFQNCHLVYLPESQSEEFAQFLTASRKPGILVVSEDKSMIGKGADIVIFVDQGKLKYIINEGSIMAKGMTPSKKLAVLGASL